MKKAEIILASVLVLIVSVVCINDWLPMFDKQKLTGAEEFQASYDVIGMLQEGSGKYAGEKYNKAEFHKILDQFSNDMSELDIYNQLIYYLAENYVPQIEELLEVNAIYQPNSQNNSTKVGNQPTLVNVVILLDASSSMRYELEGKDKMTLAKEAVKKFASKLPAGTQVTLRVYGHEGYGSIKDKTISCTTTETVYPRGAYHEKKFDAALNRVQPGDQTPLAKAIEATKDDFGHQTNTKNVVYVVSSGRNSQGSCDVDPVKATQMLNQSNIKAIVNVIGFNVTSRGYLREIADAGQGEYIQAAIPVQLTQVMQREYTRLWVAWNKWGASNWEDNEEQREDIQEQFIKKWHELREYRKQFSVGIFQEFSRLHDALSYLNEQDILDEQAYSGLRDRIRHRHTEISDYYRAIYDEKYYLLSDTRKEIQKRIKNKQK